MIDPIKSVLTLVATIFFVVSPWVSGNFSGYDPALFPYPFDRHPAQPAGYAFSIWGVIYLWLVVMAVVGMFTKRATDSAWEATRLPLIASLAPGSAWIAVANEMPIMATVLIFWMLGTALWALSKCPVQDRWLLRVPMALYAGWLTAASFVSLALIGTGFGVGPDMTAWAVTALAGALATALYALSRLTAEPAYGVAVAWGFFGIVAANAANQPFVAVLAALAGGAVGWVSLRAYQR